MTARNPSPASARALALAIGLVCLATACTNEDGQSGHREPDSYRQHLIDTPGRIHPTPIKHVVKPPADWLESGCELDLELMRRVRRGYYPRRSPDVLWVPREPNYRGAFPNDTSHSGPWDYVQEIPLVLYGPGYIRDLGLVDVGREVTLADIAPTQAELIGFDLPNDRAGDPLTEVLVPEERRQDPPRLIVTVVWDAGGQNVLDAWPDAWPELLSLIQEGAAIEGATVGSSPSVTPAAHATLGTGEFPRTHGIQNIPQRINGEMIQSFPGGNPQYLEVPTLADLYDRATGNAAKIGMFAFKYFHLGMIGHGSYLPGGDNDVAIISDLGPGELETNGNYFYLPTYLQHVPGFQSDIRDADLDDGELDGKWFEDDDLTDTFDQRNTPAWIDYQTRLAKVAITREGFGADAITDLFYTNYKELDDAGHLYNVLYPRVREMLSATDDALGDLVDFLDKRIGHGNYVLVVTADHGMTPTGLATGGLAINLDNLMTDIANHFDVEKDDLFHDMQQSVGFWLKHETLREESISLQEIADFLLGYTIADNSDGRNLGPIFEDRGDELITAAAWPAQRTQKVWNCAHGRLH